MILGVAVVVGVLVVVDIGSSDADIMWEAQRK